MKEFWNERYKVEGSAYGHEPNEFFKQQLTKLKPGKILLPAEGEGRNAVFASKMGWQVFAFDQSEAGKIKAEILARQHEVEINYVVGEFEEIEFNQESFDCIGLIYAHFSTEKKSRYHQTLDRYLKKGGCIILEAFSKKNLELNSLGINSNGPKDLGMLFSADEIKKYFRNYEIIELKEENIDLDEGRYHKGRSTVIRFVGRKK